MDYEKKYKNALTIAQSRFKIEKDESVLTCLGMMFPELRESEDERIIRAIIDALYSHTNSINLLSSRGYQMENIEAWLEKQKYDRMKPVYDNQDSFESALEKAWKDYNDSGARTVDGCEDNYVECAHAKGFREGYLFGIEKQKEQKPTSFYTPYNPDEYEAVEVGNATCLRRKEQKPAEVIKDRRQIALMIEDSRRCGVIEGRKQVIDNPGKYGLQKPAEWSEEDEKMIDAMIDIVSGSFYEPLCPRKEMLAWLKSLRPSWKPSEEEMKALDVACSGKLWYGEIYLNGLRRIREQLKKL